MPSGAAHCLALALALAGAMAALFHQPGALRAAPEDKVVAAGKLRLAGRSMSCGRTPTLMSPTFWDYGGARKGQIILNPIKLAELPDAVRLWVYAHECGHQIYGAGEIRADCYAVRRGRREGWLDAGGMTRICHFLKDHPGDWVHPPGPKRCREMTQCFRDADPHRASR